MQNFELHTEELAKVGGGGQEREEDQEVFFLGFQFVWMILF